MQVQNNRQGKASVSMQNVWPLKKLYSRGVLAAIETVRLGFAFYMITDNHLKADSFISVIELEQYEI